MSSVSDIFDKIDVRGEKNKRQEGKGGNDTHMHNVHMYTHTNTRVCGKGVYLCAENGPDGGPPQHH